MEGDARWVVRKHLEPDSHRAGLSSQVIVRAIALAVALPSCLGLAVGLIATAVMDPGIGFDALASPSVPLGDLVRGRGFATPLGVLTVGLACFAVLPAATVTLLALSHARAARWREAIIAAGVLTMLVLAASLGHR